MRKMIVLMALAFAICWAAASCGSSDVCEEAGEKIADCLKNMDCSKLDAILQPSCEELKKGGDGQVTGEAPKSVGSM